ncbi:MAG: hypothetical protein FJZ56_04365 [Chlamydiae bacterium]|nr:hypothetical protein [Chlamydiota bacterium]
MFIFNPGCYLAEGEIFLSSFSSSIPFSMKWHVFREQAGIIECCQEITIKGFSEILYNQFTFTNLEASSFDVAMENINLGLIEGKAIKSPNFIGWEFRNLKIDYEGYEYYEAVEEGYALRAEYTSSDGMRTEIKGHLSCKPVEQAI